MSDREQLPRRLAERFTVEALLGEGAMGQVFRVHDDHEGRVVALKLLKPERTEPGQLQRFKREFRAAARLHHPHCVRSLELVEHGGLAMLTMEYVPGGSLVAHRWEHAVDVVRLALQLLAGLDHIHGKRLIHRDLKPGNILIEPTDGPPHPRLADFGIADVTEMSHEDTAVGMVQGSLRYLAPETLESGVADPRSDLYSLGLILYALLAGQHPFGSTHRSLREWLSIHRRGRMRPLEQVRPDVPRALVEIVHRLCHRQPQERFADAAAAHDALARLWDELPGAGPRPEHPPLQRRPYLAAPAFVGRDEELLLLRRTHAESREGAGPTAIRVVGDAGQGKSRLLRELLVEVLDGDTMVFPSTCRLETSGPYEPLGDLLEALSDVELDGDATPVHLAVPSPRVPGLAGPDDPTADVSIASGSSPATSMVAELRPMTELPEDAMSGVLQAHARWAARMRLLCRQRPVMIILEDAQWADAPTLQLLSTMVRTMAVARQHGHAARAMLVVSHRRSADNPDLDALFETAAEYEVLTTVDLPPLPASRCTALLASMLVTRPQDVPPAFAQPLVTQAEGNPLYLAQMLYSLLGRGRLGRGPDGRWQLEGAELSAAGLPGSVTRAIGERAARLPTEHKQILVAAAVLGRQFEAGPLAALTGLDELLLLDGLDELVRTEFVEDYERSYRFVHDRIRESILEAVPAPELRRLHAQAAAHLVEHEGHRPGAWPTIAYHFEHAQQHAQALDYALRAARQASSTYAYGAALEFYDTARRVAAKDELPLPEELWELQGDACSALGHYRRAAAAYDQRLAGTTDPHERAALLSKLGLIEYKQGNYHRAIAVLEEVLAGLGLRGRIALPSRVWMVLAILTSLLPLPRWRGATRVAEVAIRTRALLAECCFMAGDPTRTALHSIMAANLARRLGPNPETVRALALSGMGMVTYGQVGMGFRQLERARATCQAIDVPESIRCQMQVFEALSSLVTGQTDQALERFEDAWRRFGAAASAEARITVLGAFAHAMVLAGRDRRRSEHYVRRLRALAEELKDTRMLGQAAYCRGHLLASDGRWDAAIASLRRGRQLSREAGDRRMEETTVDLLVVTLALAGELPEALALGKDAALAVLASPGGRNFMCHDAGLPLAAAEALRCGHALSPELEALVRRVLRRRRREALALPTAATLFLVAEAAWRKQRDKPHDLAAPIARAEQLGLRGEAALGRVVAARFHEGAGASASEDPRSLPMAPG